MLHIIYTSIFIISLAYLIILISCFRHHISTYYVLLFCAVLISDFGAMQLMSASTLETAIYANQTSYVGSSFSIFFMFMCIADLCKVTIKRIYQIIFIVYGCVLLGLTSTTGTFNLYYKSMQLVQSHGISHLVKEYGPLHTLNPLYLLVTTVLCFALIFDAFKRRRDVSYKTSAMLLLVLIFIVTLYVVEKSLHWQIEILPIGYMIGQGVVLLLLRKISLYDVEGLTKESLAESRTHGFVLCDSDGMFLGSDEDAKIWFPEINELPIDMAIKEENTPFLQQLGRWVRGEDEQKIVHFDVQDLVIEARYSVLHEHRHKSVVCIYLRDDTQQQRYTQLMKQYNENLEAAVAEKTERLSQVQDDIIISMASIVENRDNNTGGHIKRTSDVVKIFVNHLIKEKSIPGFDLSYANCMIKAAPLHDFGKIAIPDEILNKPGKFTDEEYAKMKEHSAKGAVIVAQILQNVDDENFKKIAVNVAHYHHEKWDGCGYPSGISGVQIPFEARLMALADVFDALVSKRVYKESFDYDKAFSIIEESKGSHFDPELCQEFLKCRPQLEALYDAYED